MYPRLWGAEAYAWGRPSRAARDRRGREIAGHPGAPPPPAQTLPLGEGAACAPHCVDNRNHKIAITVSEAVNKEDIPGF